MSPSFVFEGRPCNSTTWKFCWAGTDTEGEREGPRHHPFVAVSHVLSFSILFRAGFHLYIRNLWCVNVAAKEWSSQLPLMWGGMLALGQNQCSYRRMIRANVAANKWAMLGINIIINWSSSSHEDCSFWFDSDSEGIFFNSKGGSLEVRGP